MNHPSRIWLLAIGGSIGLHLAAIAVVALWAAHRSTMSPMLQLRAGGVDGVRVTLVSFDDRTADSRQARAREDAARQAIEPRPVKPRPRSPAVRDNTPSLPQSNAMIGRFPPVAMPLLTTAEISAIEVVAQEAAASLRSTVQAASSSQMPEIETRQINSAEWLDAAMETADSAASESQAVTALPGGAIAGADHQPLPKATNRPPEYPFEARRRGESGTVVLRVVIEASGRVSGLVVDRSSGFARLDQSASEAVRRWRFEPASDRDGSPMRCEIRLPVEFLLRG